MNSWSGRLTMAVIALGLLAVAGCWTTNRFIVPSPIIRDYDNPMPVTVGFLFVPEVRDLWYHSQSGSSRVDVPVGKLAMDFARANFQNAVSNFYTERYLDRRSQRGVLIDMRRVRFEMGDNTAVCNLDIVVLDAANKEILKKSYSGVGQLQDADKSILRPYTGESKLELVTAQAFSTAFQEMLADVRALLGAQLAQPPDAAAAPAEPAGAAATPAAPAPATAPAAPTPAPTPTPAQ